MKRTLVNWGGHEPEACATLFASLLRDKDFDVPEAREIMLRALLWAAR